MNVERCHRKTKRGRVCQQKRIAAGSACHLHLTDSERAAYERDRAEWAARWNCHFARPDEPACWSWEMPGNPEDARQRLLAEGDLSAETIDLLIKEWNGGFDEFHQSRCAICGRRDDRLVDDHDHRTGFRRGWLCRSCNVIEGKDRGGVFEMYRQCPPAAILGVQLPYTGYGWEDGVPIGGWERYCLVDDDEPDWRTAAIMAKIFDDTAEDVREDVPHAA